MRTRITEDYGIEVPVVLAGMAFIGLPALAAAVSNAGGLGTLGGLGSPLVSPDALRRMIQATRSLTERPFGVNLATKLTRPEHIAVCIEERVSVVSFDMGDPPELFIERLRIAGIRAWVQVGSVAAARSAVRAGASGLIAQGTESGGGQRSVAATMTLIPSVVDAVAPISVIAGGGIGDGRGLAAALALGADAVWVGTRFIATREANAHVEFKRRIVDASEADTVITTVFATAERARRPVRALRNRVVREWNGRDEVPGLVNAPGRIGETEWDGQPLPLYRHSGIPPTPETTGDLEDMCLPAGESAALVRDIRPAREVVREMAATAERIMGDRLLRMIGGGSDGSDAVAGLAAPTSDRRAVAS